MDNYRIIRYILSMLKILCSMIIKYEKNTLQNTALELTYLYKFWSCNLGAIFNGNLCHVKRTAPPQIMHYCHPVKRTPDRKSWPLHLARLHPCTPSHFSFRCCSNGQKIAPGLLKRKLKLATT